MRRPLMIPLAALFCVAALTPQARAQTYHGIYVAAPGDIWLVGEGGVVVHGRAGSWVRTPQGSPLPDMNAVTGFGADNVWAVGDEGTILHWDGERLTRPNSGTSARLVAVFGCAPNDVWAVGDSEDRGQPAVATHYDGASWTAQRLPLEFHPTAITGCPDLVVSGVAFFDPRPDQRRDIGVVARLRAGQWTISGWDGRRVNDELIGGTSWTGAAGTGGMTVIWGRGKALVSRGGGAWTALGGVPEALTMVVTMDGSMAAIHEGGFSRWTGGSQWRTVGQGATDNSATNAYVATAQSPAGRDTAAVRRIQARMEAISRSVPEGGQPNAAQIGELMQLSQQLMVANGGAPTMAQMQQMSAQTQSVQAEQQRNVTVIERNATLAFGGRVAVFGGRGSDFYVAGERLWHVTGDVSKVVFVDVCLYAAQQQLPASLTTECRADGGTGGPPAALNVPPPTPRVDGPGVNAPSRANPLPSIRRPRVRIP